MITVEEKLKIFSDKILEKVKKETESKYEQFYKENKEFVDLEKANAVVSGESLVKEALLKSEAEKKQDIHKAVMKKERFVIEKRFRIYEQFLAEIYEFARTFTDTLEYLGILLKCIDSGIKNLQVGEGVIYTTKKDFNKYKKDIKIFLEKNFAGLIYTVKVTDSDIIGGCLVEDKDGLYRMDCSFSAMIYEHKNLIGKVLNDNL